MYNKNVLVLLTIKAKEIEDSELSDVSFNDERQEKQPFLMRLLLNDYLKPL